MPSCSDSLSEVLVEGTGLELLPETLPRPSCALHPIMLQVISERLVWCGAPTSMSDGTPHHLSDQISEAALQVISEAGVTSTNLNV